MTPDDIAGTVTASFTLVGMPSAPRSTTRAAILSAPRDADQSAARAAGRQRRSHSDSRLLPSSPAINRGGLDAIVGVGDIPVYDQRGNPFGRVVNARFDLGAFEFQEASDLNLIVDTLVDESDDSFVPGDLSLREAVELANTFPSTDTIRFDPAYQLPGLPCLCSAWASSRLPTTC